MYKKKTGNNFAITYVPITLRRARGFNCYLYHYFLFLFVCIQTFVLFDAIINGETDNDDFIYVYNITADKRNKQQVKKEVNLSSHFVAEFSTFVDCV